MCKITRWIGLLCAWTVSAGLLCACAPAAMPEFEGDAGPVFTPILKAATTAEERHEPERMEKAAEKGFLALYADMDTGEFAVEDRRTGQLWYSNPPDRAEDEVASGAMRNSLSSQLMVNTIVDETKTVKSYNSYVSCQKRGGVTVKAEEDGIRVEYTFVKEGFTIPVTYTLLEDSLRAEIRAEEIREDSEIRLLSVTLLPVMGACGAKEQGFILLGDGNMIDFSNGKTDVSPYRVPIYGDDAVTVDSQKQTTSPDTLLPVFGLSADSRGMLAVCDKGAGQGVLNASPAGLQTGYQTACAEFELRITQLVTVGSDDGNGREVTTLEKEPLSGEFAVRYFFLGEEDSGVAGMARVTADYFISQGVTPQERSETAPLYLTALGAVRYPSSVAGFRVDVTRVMTSYADAEELLRTLGDQGVSGVRMLFSGWSRSGLSGIVTTAFDPVGDLGSDHSRAALSEALTAQGGTLAYCADLVKYSRSGNGFSLKSDGIRDVLHRTVNIPVYKRNTFLADNTADNFRILRAEKSAQALLRFSSALPDDAALMTGSLSRTLSSDYGDGGQKRHGAQVITAQAFSEAAKTRALIGDAPYAYTWSALREAVGVPLTAANYPVTDRSVPFAAIVLRRLMPCGSAPLNCSGNPTRDFLRCIAAGVAPHYEISASTPEILKNTDLDSFYGADIAALGTTLAAQYARYAELYAKTRLANITSLTVKGDLSETVYENGVTVLVNTGDTPIWVGENTIPAEDFIVTGGETP